MRHTGVWPNHQSEPIWHSLFFNWKIWGGVSSNLNGGKTQPFLQGPDVICQPRRHGRSSPPPTAVLTLDPQGSHHPTEVVSIQREIRHRLMNPPVLTEPISPPRLPRVLAPVRRVLTLHERGVDRPAAHRVLQRLV